MTGYLDDAPLGVPCAKCGAETQKTFGWLKANQHLTCSCGFTIVIDDHQVRESLGKVDRSLDDLRKSLRDLKRFK